MSSSNAAWLPGSGPQPGPRLVPDPFGPLTETEKRQERVNAAAEPYETMEPPPAADLGIKIDASIPPQRARLIRFHTWVVNLQKQLAELEQGREALFEKLNLPAVTERQIEALAAADKTGLITWMKTGAKSLLTSLSREHEHAALTARLEAGSYEAGIAQAALVEIEEQIDALAAQIKTLEYRRRRFVGDALVEHAGPAGAAYLAAVKDLSDRLAVLMGLGAVARCGAEYASLPVTLPGFGPVTGRDDRPQVSADEQMIEAAAGPWRDLAALWAADPRAEPKAAK